MLDGRVRRLTRLFTAGFSRAGYPEHMRALTENGIGPIDLVAVNLYPFERTVARAGATVQRCRAEDIGGPSMLRSAAKHSRQ